MKRNIGVWTVTILLSICVPTSVFAQSNSSLELGNVDLELQTLNTKLDLLENEMSQMADDMKELKDCNIMARQRPTSIAEIRKELHPATKAEDAGLVALYQADVIARSKCGLPIINSK